MFTECGENLGPAQVELYCEELSPATNDTCIPLSTFIEEHEPGTVHTHVFHLFSACLLVLG